MAKGVNIRQFLVRKGVCSEEMRTWMEVFVDSNREATRLRDTFEKQKAADQARRAEQKVRELAAREGVDPDEFLRDFRKELRREPMPA